MGRTINRTLLPEDRSATELAATARTASTANSASTATAAALDAADVLHAAAGDLAAFERIYRRHCARIHTLARRILGAAQAEEATQDAFVRAWEKLATFRGEAAFATWLHRVALNLFLGLRARDARLRDRFREDAAFVAAAPARSAHPELRLDLERAIEELPDGARQVFTLYDVEGYRHEEIASLLEISVGTSKSQLHRARMLLRAQLTR